MQLSTTTVIALVSCVASIVLGGFAIWQNSKIIQIEHKSQELSRDIAIIEKSPNIQQSHLIISADSFLQLSKDGLQSTLPEIISLPRFIDSTGLIEFIAVAKSGSKTEKRSTFGLFLSIKNYSEISAQNLILLENGDNKILMGSISPGERKLILISAEKSDPFSEIVYYEPKFLSFEYEFNGGFHERSLSYIPPSKRAWIPHIGEIPQFGSATTEDPNSALMED